MRVMATQRQLRRGCVALALMIAGGMAQAQAISGAPYVAVRGQAKQEVVPDLFPVEVTLSETSLDTAKTQAMIEGLAKDVLAIAERMQVAEADLTVSNLSISPEYRYDQGERKQIYLGNTYEREIKVRFHSLDRLREFIAALPAAKAVRVDTGTFETSRADELRKDLLQQAIDDARATAQALAAGVGRKLGPVHTISNQGFNLTYSRSINAIDVSGTQSVALFAPGAIVLREGRITLDQDVYIVYVLE